ncbi:MAG: sulfite exporter TauE/SafE family protein [Dehalococcoidia bacterium]|nr:sulfite exporter TauE/SafE family protein [Dehalococcoidia bacterium]
MLTDPWFYAAAVPALLLVGISKGGFGGGLGVVGVPMLALVISPTQAAAILLPVLCAMDLVGLFLYRREWDRSLMRVLAPGAVAGILLGAFTFALTDDDVVRLLVGVIAVGFTLWQWGGRRLVERLAERRSEEHGSVRPNLALGSFWASVSGYTSFIAHAGGPPLSVYLLPLRLDKTTFVGTTVVYFALVNYVKLVPYGLLGQFDTANLATSAALLPLAPVGVLLGAVLHRRLREDLLYGVVYAALFVTGVKLLIDGSVVFQ